MNKFYQKDPYFSLFMKIFSLFSLFKDKTAETLKELNILDLSIPHFLVLYNVYLHDRPIQASALNKDGFYKGKNIFFIVNKLVNKGYLDKKNSEGYTHFKDITITSKGFKVASLMEDEFKTEYKRLFTVKDFTNLMKCLDMLEDSNDGG